MLQSRSCQFGGIVAVCYLLLIVPADATAPAYLFGPSLASAGSLLAHKIVLRLTTTSTCWMFKLQFSTDCRLRVPNSEHIPNIAEMPWKHCWKTCCFAALALFLYASCVETTVRCCQSISSQSSPSHQRDRKDLPIFAIYQLSYNSRSCTAPLCRLLGWHSHFAKLLPGGTFFSVYGFTLAGCILTLGRNSKELLYFEMACTCLITTSNSYTTSTSQQLILISIELPCPDPDRTHPIKNP